MMEEVEESKVINPPIFYFLIQVYSDLSFICSDVILNTDITGYYIEKKDANSDNWQRCNHSLCPTNIFNVPNLIEDREYEFRVFAVNEAGESKPSTATRKVKVRDPNGKFQLLRFNTFILEILK